MHLFIPATAGAYSNKDNRTLSPGPPIPDAGVSILGEVVVVAMLVRRLPMVSSCVCVG